MTVLDCAVVGDGIVGRFTALALAARGLRVALCGGAPGDAGSSASALSGGLVRAYSPDPDLTRLAVRSMTAVWWNCPAYRRTGSVHVVPRAALNAEVLAEMAAAGIPYRVADGPGHHPVRLDPGDCAVVEPHGGYVLALPALTWLAERCAAEPAIVPGGPVGRIDTGADAFTLVGPDLRARRVIVTAGPGTVALVPVTGLQQRRIVYSFVRLDTDVGHTLVDTAPDAWMRPAPEQGPGVHLVGRADPRPWDRPGRRGVDDPPAGRRATEALARRLPAMVRATYLSSVVASDMYTTSGPGRVGPTATATDGLWFMTGLSGGGFKIAPALAERAADRVMTSLERTGTLR
ncbi:FAD-dependent oxidoreductase [Actinoplanes sp. NPDC023801]|uniref:NAD(P)/FAD-dependent oxidoreductase n=1 Tax=Actinoplanes sp. NPDC023801 TaxID=3154595 RepID=UPI0033F3D6C5